MTPEADARTYDCRYCGTRIQVAIQSRQLAAGLQLDLSNLDQFLQQLSTILAAGFGDAARVQHHEGRIVVLELRLESDLYLAKREPHGIVAQHKKLVRGVALKTATHPLERWVELLTNSIAQHANTNASAAGVLAQLRGG